jgi:hypothetical protein
MDLFKSIIGDVNPKELFETLIGFMHQTVAHQKKIEAGIEDIQRRLKVLEDARVSDNSNV